MEVRSKWQAESDGRALPSLPYDAGEPIAQLHDAAFEALTATEDDAGCAGDAPAFESVLLDLGKISILIAPDYDPSVPNADGTTAGDRTDALAEQLGLEPAFGADRPAQPSNPVVRFLWVTGPTSALAVRSEIVERKPPLAMQPASVSRWCPNVRIGYSVGVGEIADLLGDKADQKNYRRSGKCLFAHSNSIPS
jgi:hypothetical protein